MLEKFRPDKYYKNIYQIDFVKLKNEGIKLITFDLDNTLVPHDVLDAPNGVIELINNVKELGIEVIIISNNNEKRVARFCEKMDIKFYFSARKPLKKTFIRIVNESEFKKNEICLVGDQIMTDVWGANRVGIVSVLVDPLAQRDILYTKVNRIFERKIIKRLQRKNLFESGKYYD